MASNLTTCLESKFFVENPKFLLFIDKNTKYTGVDVELADPKTIVGPDVGLADDFETSRLFFDGTCIKYVDYDLRRWDGQNDTFYLGEVIKNYLLSVLT